MPALRDYCPITRGTGPRDESPEPEVPRAAESGRVASRLEGTSAAKRMGLRPVFKDEGHAVVTLPVHRGSGDETGSADPSAITALVQAAAALAAGCTGEEGEVSLSGLSLNFVRPVSERPLVAEARVLGGDRSLRSCEVEVSDWNGTLVAKGFMTYGLRGV
jgi:uncharacterized protein (TIGR00369 family)